MEPIESSRLIMNFFLTLFFLTIFCCSASASDITDNANKTIRLATTTSTANSGLLSYLLPFFKEKTGYSVHVIAVGTGKALRMGEDGDVDVLLVHALSSEKEFIKKGHGIKRFSVMHNDFVIIGPKKDPAEISKTSSLNSAFQKIQSSKSLFISRGDDSGTDKKEKKIWSAAHINPTKKNKKHWYREIGQGMGKAIQMADELRAYTLTDRGTWLSYRDKVDLSLLFQGDKFLFNPYGIIAVNPLRHKNSNIIGANSLIQWITSKQGQKLIGQYKKEGEVLFTPSTE